MQDYLYALPFSHTEGIYVSRPAGEFAHENFPESKYAIDFLLDPGTPIYAARAGKVFLVRNDFSWHGLDSSRSSEVNMVAIDHNDGTGAEYVHFAQGSIGVEEGRHVNAGDLLGKTGYSGVMDVPHLHFNVFRFTPKKAGVSIPVKFAVDFYGE